jgi:histidyl-tRNA synthetase
MKLQPVRGTRDLRGNELKSFLDIVSTARQTAALYGFEEIETPIFEATDVFSRTLGDASDIVTKEMYTFTDKSGDSLTLRPEGTAPVMRSVISESLFRELPLKFFYQGPMFRHERPQKGRYRQFYQIGVELIGVPSPVVDAEVISLAWTIFQKLGVEKNIQLELNSIGDSQTRKAYREALQTHFRKHLNELSEDSKNRLEKNPLRILDSKAEEDKPFVASAPKMADSMTPEAALFFEQLQTHIKALGIPYVLNDKLVRGLDYYCHTVFEFTTTALGAQNAVLSGGRYDGLIETMGGPATPGVGWGGGIDRLALLAQKTFAEPLTMGVIPLNPENETEALRIMEDLRRNGIPAQMPYSGNLSKRLKKLDRLNCAGAIIVGGDEEAKGQVQFKDFKSSSQSAVDKTNLLPHLKATVFAGSK